MNSSIEILNTRIGSFVKHYYLREALQGLLLTSAVFLALWLVLAQMAYFFYLSSSLRTTLFYSFWTAILFIGIALILWPLLKAFRLITGMNEEKASKIIGAFHADIVSDQLLNAVQLAKKDPENELIKAAINQKTKLFSEVNFLQAIPQEKIRNAAYYTFGVVGVFVLLLIWRPLAIKEGSSRMLAHEQQFVPENPFKIKILNSSLKGLRNDPFTIEVEFLGNQVPAEVFVKSGEEVNKMVNRKDQIFEYRISHLTKDLSFQLQMGIHFSPIYSVQVVDKPSIDRFEIMLDFPSYTGETDKKESKNGNITVPEGTKLQYKIFSSSSKEALCQIDNRLEKIPFKNDYISFETVAHHSFHSEITLSNQHFDSIANNRFNVEVIKDEFPQIAVEEMKDSLRPFVQYFSGVVADDYGLSELLFHFETSDSSLVRPITLKGKKQQQFTHYIDLQSLSEFKGQTLTCYFEIKDNDQVNGAKSSFSKKTSYVVPGKKEVEQLKNELSEELENLMANALSKSQEIQKEYKEIKRLLLEDKANSWENQQKIQQFLHKQSSLQEDLSKIKQKSEEKSQKEQYFDPKNEDLLSKQEQIDQLLEDLLDEETKKMFEELEKMMEQLNEKQDPQALEKLNLDNENLSKSLDRTLEMFKQLEFQNKLDEAIKNLEELSQKENALQNEKEEQQLEKQEKINQEFNELQKQLEELNKKNQELTNKQPFDGANKEQEEIKESLNKATEKLQEGKPKGSKPHQKQASDQMKNLANKLEQMNATGGQEQDAEDLQSMRQLLENLIFLSVEQEKLLEKSKKLSSQDPQFIELGQQQKKLLDDAKVIEDSLFALSKRQIALKSFINKELHEMAFNAGKSIDYLAERRSYQAAVHQQYVMTSANNLALILDESIQQMQNEAMQKQFGTGSCNKPGGANPKPGSDMQSLKDMLSKQMEMMKKELEKKGNKPGNTGKTGKSGEAKSFGQMAAEQNAMKEKLRKMAQQLQKEGKGGLGNLEQIADELEKNEKELLNKRLSPETLMRQEQIMTRLLEAEKAIREREYDEKRESQEGKKEFNRNPEEFLEYKKIEMSEEEMLKILLPSLNLFYKKKVNEYFNAVD